MPKRSFDFASMDPNMPLDKSQRKTERSHEENQERAYIAASRRADRSIEARVQSARMASEIHKKRTGKAFRISEEIVMKEEMYEEEEDDFPRSYRLLGANMQTPSSDLNSRVETYLTNRVAMSKLLSSTDEDWRENEVNRAFAQMFPNANRQAQSLSQRWSVPGYPAPTDQSGHPARFHASPDPTFDPSFQSVKYDQMATHNDRSRSLSDVPPSDGQIDGQSPPALTPGSGGSYSDSPQSPEASITSLGMAPNGGIEGGLNGSAFTTELPAEAKMLMGGTGLNDTFSMGLFGQDWDSSAPMYDFGDMKPSKTEDSSYVPFDLDTSKWDPSLQPINAADEPSWESFINDNVWGVDQQ